MRNANQIGKASVVFYGISLLAVIVDKPCRRLSRDVILFGQIELACKIAEFLQKLFFRCVRVLGHRRFDLVAHDLWDDHTVGHKVLRAQPTVHNPQARCVFPGQNSGMLHRVVAFAVAPDGQQDGVKAREWH